MFQKANYGHIAQIDKIYNDIHSEEESGRAVIGWMRGVYPTKATALIALEKNDLFVFEVNGEVLASARINKEQVPEYKNAHWEYQAKPDEVMVLHTLVVSPKAQGQGIAKQFVSFYEKYAKDNGCKYLRLDTNEKNIVARVFYKKLGYKEVDIVPCNFNGIPNIGLVCIEKKL